MLLVSCSVMSDSCMYNWSMPGFPFLHHLPELAQTHVHWVRYGEIKALVHCYWECKMVQPFGNLYGSSLVSQVVLVVKNSPSNAGDVSYVGSIPGSRRSPEGGHGNPLQYSCLNNPKDRGAWRATLHRVAKSQTWLKRLGTQHACMEVP